MTVGGNLIDYPGDCSTDTADLVTAKILFNETVSDPEGKFMGLDIKDFYLNNDLPRKECVCIPVHFLTQDIIDQCDLEKYIVDGKWNCAEVGKGMCGLPQAGKVANDALVPCLKKAGYVRTGRTPGLFKHNTNSVIFCLVVDDFGVKYRHRKDAEHLRDTLRKDYPITEDWEGTTFCGLTLEWDYAKRHVGISMPGYIQKALSNFTHPAPKRPQHAPSQWTVPNCGQKVQFAEPEDETPPLSKASVTRLQQIIGTLLYCARAVDSTMLVALSTLASAQSCGTEATMDAATHLLNCAHTHPDAKVRFHKSDMVLCIHSDASYLSEPKARSRVGGYFYLSNKDKPADNPNPNGAIHIESRIMRNVMASASEAETGGLFHNGQEGAHIRQILHEIGRTQTAPTPIITDNSTADGFANDKTKIEQSKAMDMRFYWIKDRVRQGQFSVHWSPGANNKADYYTTHDQPAHHIQMRPTYLQTALQATVSSQADCEGVLIRDSGLSQSHITGSPNGIQSLSSTGNSAQTSRCQANPANDGQASSAPSSDLQLSSQKIT